jgi:hypothetical protein
MPFTLTASTAIGSVSFYRPTAQGALDKMHELQSTGLRVEVKDDGGRKIAEGEVASLTAKEID